jgi:hypothetical protein
MRMRELEGCLSCPYVGMQVTFGLFLRAKGASYYLATTDYTNRWLRWEMSVFWVDAPCSLAEVY